MEFGEGPLSQRRSSRPTCRSRPDNDLSGVRSRSSWAKRAGSSSRPIVSVTIDRASSRWLSRASRVSVSPRARRDGEADVRAPWTGPRKGRSRRSGGRSPDDDAPVHRRQFDRLLDETRPSAALEHTLGPPAVASAIPTATVRCWDRRRQRPRAAGPGHDAGPTVHDPPPFPLPAYGPGHAARPMDRRPTRRRGLRGT